MTSTYQFQDEFFMADQPIHDILPILTYVHIEVKFPWKYDFFPILDSAYAILVLCSRQVLAMSKEHPWKYFSFIESL